MQKKQHPNGLPHLNDAKQPNGGVNQEQVLAGARAWSEALAAGDYTLTDVHEYALDDKRDVLIIHRTKN